MLFTQDMKDLIEAFEKHGVQYHRHSNLLAAKRNSERPRDLTDVDELEKTNRHRR
jgi:hypothetical protein